MARILIAPTKSKSVKDKVSELLKKEGHSLYDSNITSIDWASIDPEHHKWSPKEAMSSLLGTDAVKSAYAELERDMRSADACLLFFPASQDAAVIAGWFAANQKDVVGLVSGDGELPLLAFMTSALCLSTSEVVEAFQGR